MKKAKQNRYSLYSEAEIYFHTCLLCVFHFSAPCVWVHPPSYQPVLIPAHSIPTFCSARFIQMHNRPFGHFVSLGRRKGSHPARLMLTQFDAHIKYKKLILSRKLDNLIYDSCSFKLRLVHFGLVNLQQTPQVGLNQSHLISFLLQIR